MVMFSPVLNVIPLSGVLALLITLWINTQINRELLEKLDEVEKVIISAVNTSRDCGKDLANKTVIAIGINYRIKQLRDMNEEYSQQNDTIMAKSNKDTIEDDPVNIPKKIRQNRLQMYGVRITTDILIF